MPSWSPGPRLQIWHSTLLALLIPGSKPTPVTQASTCRTSLLQPQTLASTCAMLNPTILDPACPCRLLIQTYSHGSVLQACSLLPELQPSPHGPRTQPGFNDPRHQSPWGWGDHSPMLIPEESGPRTEDGWLSSPKGNTPFLHLLHFQNYLILLLCSI